MAEEIYGLKSDTKDQVLDLVRRSADVPPAMVPPHLVAAHHAFIVCGSVIDDVGGFRYYSGTPKLFNATDGAYVNPPGGSADTVFLISRIDLVAGQTYLAQATGLCTVDEQTRPGYVAEVRKFKWVRQITGDPYCDGGNLVIPWEWAPALDLGDPSGFLLPPPPPPP